MQSQLGHGESKNSYIGVEIEVADRFLKSCYYNNMSEESNFG